MRICVHVDMYNMDSFNSSLRSLTSSWPLDPSLLSCWHLDIGVPRAAGLLVARWVSHLDMGADGFAGTALAGAQIRGLILRSPCFVFLPAFVSPCSSRLVQVGLSSADRLGRSWAGNYLGFPSHHCLSDKRQWACR